MTETISVNAVDRSSVIRRETVEWAEGAYLGEMLEGGFVIDDAAGSITVPGFKDITVVQDASTPSRIFTGFAGKKSIRRGTTYQTGASREYAVGTRDLNDLLKRHIIQGTGAAGGNRPAETINARMTWLLASDFVDFADRGAVASSTEDLDKQDLRGMYAGDVLAGMAKAVNFNYDIRYHASGPELVFRDDNASTDDTCTLSISNVASDVNGTTVFPPFQEAELGQDPEHVYSGLYGLHGKGQIYETLPATAAAFVERDGMIEDFGTRTDSTMSRDAQRQLSELDTEEQLLPVVIRLRKAKVGLVKSGMRISTRMSHMAPEGWDPARYARILRLRVTQPTNTDEDYDLHLDLSPQEVPPTPDACSDTYPNTPSDTYYPLGGSGSIPNASDGISLYWRAGYAYAGNDPITGRTDHGFHFAAYGAGGVGTIDYLGDCTQNRLLFRVVGNGTISVQTETYGGVLHGVEMYRDGVLIASGTTGDVLTFVQDDVSDPYCVQIIEIRDLGSCGGKVGWSAMEWVAA